MLLFRSNLVTSYDMSRVMMFPKAASQPQLVWYAPAVHSASWRCLCLTDTCSARARKDCGCGLQCTLCICCMQVMHLLLLELLKRPRDAALLEFMRIDEMLIDIGEILHTY